MKWYKLFLTIILSVFPKHYKKAIFKSAYIYAKQTFEDSSINQAGAWLVKLLANCISIAPTGMGDSSAASGTLWSTQEAQDRFVSSHISK